MRKMEKKVSVIMSVYNGEEYLECAMESLLEQTFEEWECIAVNDCSRDSTGEILAAYARRAPRIRVVENEVNLKLPASLNKAMLMAEGRYIMRMDADDICRKDRMEKQVAYMETHPELALSCCHFFVLSGDKMIPANMQRRGDSDAVAALFLFFDPILHPGVIAVRDEICRLKYNPIYSCAEDLELWTRMLMAGKKMGIQDDYLMVYRIHDKQVTATTNELQREQYRQIIDRFYRECMFALSGEELEFLTTAIYYRDRPDPERYMNFLGKVRKMNKMYGRMPEEAVTYAAFEVFKSYSSELSLGMKQKLGALSSFPSPFVLKEYIRRKKSFRKSKDLCREAAEIFPLKKAVIDPKQGIMCYERGKEADGQ